MSLSAQTPTMTLMRGRLKTANKKHQADYPGISEQRQPVHTVYGGAHLFSAALTRKMSEAATKVMEVYALIAEALVSALGLTGPEARLTLWREVEQRVRAKLKTEPVEDFRIDFEDGYGNRPWPEEDDHAAKAALEVARAMKEGTLPPFIGIRIKALNEENADRSLRTLEIFIRTLAQETDSRLPNNFVVTLPKITNVAQSETLAAWLEQLELRYKLANGLLKYEIMVETPEAVLGANGVSPLRSFVAASAGRCVGAHFGSYDYTASCQITAAYQTMDHPVCDFAKHVMQVSLAGLPVMLSDGATNILPIGPHKGAWESLTPAQQGENRDTVHRAWRLSYRHITNSLATGFYQGWDLHPAQLPIRYAAVYAFFLAGLEAATERLTGFMERAARATLRGDVFDDAATGQGLLNVFLRGLSCGAITTDEALRSGLTVDELRSRSFLKILQDRKRL